MKDIRIELETINLSHEAKEALDNFQPVYVVDGITEKYVMIDANQYDHLIAQSSDDHPFFDKISIVSPDSIDLNLDEIEELRKMLIQTLKKERKKNK